MTVREKVYELIVIDRSRTPRTFAAFSFEIGKLRVEAVKAVGSSVVDQNSWLEEEVVAACAQEACLAAAAVLQDKIYVTPGDDAPNVRAPGTETVKF